MRKAAAFNFVIKGNKSKRCISLSESNFENVELENVHDAAI